MDMFQAPTLLEDQFNGTSTLHVAERGFDGGYSRNGKYVLNSLINYKDYARSKQTAHEREAGVLLFTRGSHFLGLL